MVERLIPNVQGQPVGLATTLSELLITAIEICYPEANEIISFNSRRLSRNREVLGILNKNKIIFPNIFIIIFTYFSVTLTFTPILIILYQHIKHHTYHQLQSI